MFRKIHDWIASLHRPMGRISSARCSRKGAQSPIYTRMEPRNLLAGITFNQASSEVEIEGTSGDDVVLVSVVGENLKVTLSGFPASEFALSQISAVRFWGRHGDDFFRNDTSVNSFGYGHAGNDHLIGGSGVDRFQGGHGNDRLEGRGANDGLRGNVGDDVLIGGDDNDFIYGGAGSDNINGDDGDDRLAGNQGNDVIRGGLGNDWINGNEDDDELKGQGGDDSVYGGAGNDLVFGDSGNDLLNGEAGNDVIDGGSGDDMAFGGPGADQISGGLGADALNGGLDDDVLNGDEGNDRLTGDVGDDELAGGPGRDVLFGNEGIDQLRGDGDDDQLYGGNDDDVLYGGSGNDLLNGDNGNDELRGQSGTDQLNGGAGLDGLFGGIGGNDRLDGGRDGDRLLIWSGDTVTNVNSGDGVIQFVNRTHSWNESEILIVDEGLRSIHHFVGNGKIFRDSLDDDPVLYVKYSASTLSGAAQNHLTTRTTNGVRTYDREIRIADWNENSEAENSFYRYAAIHEISHSWDSAEEINNRLSGQGGVWSSFLSLSGWRSTNPNSSNYSRSGDGSWWYLNSAKFARSYGKHNPQEDWGTVWEILFDPSKANSVGTIQSKANKVYQLLNAF
ncbi:MAG: calcium-binding protein [Pirellulaceae bacterium]